MQDSREFRIFAQTTIRNPMYSNPHLNERVLAVRASDKIEAKLFYAEKRLQELELQFEGIIACKLDRDQIADSIVAQQSEVATLKFIDELVQDRLNQINKR